MDELEKIREENKALANTIKIISKDLLITQDQYSSSQKSLNKATNTIVEERKKNEELRARLINIAQVALRYLGSIEPSDTYCRVCYLKNEHEEWCIVNILQTTLEEI